MGTATPVEQLLNRLLVCRAHVDVHEVGIERAIGFELRTDDVALVFVQPQGAFFRALQPCEAGLDLLKFIGTRQGQNFHGVVSAQRKLLFVQRVNSLEVESTTAPGKPRKPRQVEAVNGLV